MTDYTVSIEIKDRPGQGPAILCSISPPPPPETTDRSQAVALWLVLRDRIFQFNKEHSHAVKVEKQTRPQASVKGEDLPHGRNRPKAAGTVRKARR